MTKIKRDYKSRMFTMIFSDKKELLGLYNAIANRNYEDPELLTINTLENAIYMSMANDLSFIIDCRVPIVEQQSTHNPNMPLRCLMYSSDLYSVYTANSNLYGTKLVKIPTPRFIVFYNGKDERPEKEIMKLSDAFMVREEEVSLELIVEVYNINDGYNEELKHACKALRDYSIYVQLVRRYRMEGMSIEEAVECAIVECIDNDVLREFLINNRAEAKAVSIYEYNEEEHMRMEREQHFADGFEQGLENGIAQGLQQGELMGVVEMCREFGLTEEQIIEKLVEKYNLEEAKAREYCTKKYIDVVR